MEHTLGIDQSYTCTGYVLLDESEAMTKFGTFKTDKTKDVFLRAIELADFVLKLIDDNNVKKVRIEGLAFGIRGDATRDLAGLQFTVITQIRKKHPGIDILIIPPTSLKKFATGTGKSEKAAMISHLPDAVQLAFTEAKYKKSSGLADLADAYWLSKWVVAEPIA